MVEIFRDNFDRMRSLYSKREDGEKEEMKDFFNSALDNFGDILFGEDSDPLQLSNFVKSLDDA